MTRNEQKRLILLYMQCELHYVCTVCKQPDWMCRCDHMYCEFMRYGVDLCRSKWSMNRRWRVWI